MDLSYEDRWINLRRQIEDDIAWLEGQAAQHRSPTLRAKVQALVIVRDSMDAADRVGAHRA